MSGRKLSVLATALTFVLSSPAAFAHKHHATPPETNYKNMAFANTQEQPQFELFFDPMLLKAGASNLNYVIFNKFLPAQSPSWTELELKPKYAFAFQLGGRYLFTEGRDVSLDWTHLNSSTSSSVIAPSTQYFLGPDFQIGPNSGDITQAYGKVHFWYDVINLSAGQHIDFGHHVSVRLFGGLSDGLLREQVTSIYSGTTTGAPFGPFSMAQQVTANFTGVGPRLGLDASYNLDCGISFYGEGAGTALIGSSYSRTTYTGSAPTLLALFGQTVNSQFVKDQNVTQVLPGFDTKIGVNYSRLFNHGIIATIGAGYQAAVYINAINQYTLGSMVSGTAIDLGGVFAATIDHTQSNYSVQGPFLKFAIKF